MKDKMDKLITMTEYVKWLETQIILINGSVKDVRIACQMMIKYANLLRKPLSLSMFIPCNEKGEPTEKPDINMIIEHQDSCECSHCQSYYRACGQYQKVLDKVLFEGWIVAGKSDLGILDLLCGETHLTEMKIVGKTIENLINSGIELTPTENCKKQIGL